MAWRRQVKKAKPKGWHKYKAVKTEVNGIIFPSKSEAKKYTDLLLEERAGEIAELELQPEFPIEVAGVKICVYKADFRYLVTKTNERVVMDVKGMKTPVYRLKKKLVEAIYGIKITEV
jgi:hypothetical protein